MTRPSDAHERRVETLRALADLSGFVQAVTLAGLRPDLCRVDHRARLLVGDAKATETPGDTETRLRWGRYVRRARHSLGQGRFASVILMVCAGGHIAGWEEHLLAVAQTAPLPARASGSTLLSPDTRVAWVVVGYKQADATLERVFALGAST